MTKKVSTNLSFIVIFLLIGVFVFNYYIKPKREFIKINTQNCINTAFAPINNEVVKTYFTSYITRQGIKNMLKTQENELDICLNGYDSIIFSKPEKDIVELNIKERVASQLLSIESYNKRVDAAITESNKQKEKRQLCDTLEAEYKKYQDCEEQESKKMFEPNYKKPAVSCSVKYNVQEYLNNMSSCLMMRIYGN